MKVFLQVLGYGFVGIGLLLSLGMSKSKAKIDENIIVLSEKNTVSLNTPIMPDTARTAQEDLLAASDKLSKNDPIYLVLNTPGGSIEAGNEIIATAKGLPQKVHTITMFSASMGFQIVQNLDTRYMLPSATMMSHRAAVGGVQGNIPGSAFTRLYYFLEMVTNLDAIAAKRAGMDFEQYQAAVAEELWLGSENAVAMNFADKIVNVQCDKTLRGPGKEQTISVFIFTVKVRYNKCPLITSPEFLGGDNYTFQLLNGPKRELVKTFSY